MAQQNFQSLLPKDDVDLHSYQDALDYAMEHEEIRNVALSGSYGSGKSSVINSYEKCRTAKKFLHISLADFDKVGALVSAKAGEPVNAKDTAKCLEGKILNRLLHQIDPENIRQSQFRIKTDGQPHHHAILTIFCTIYALFLFYAIRFDAWKAFAATLPPGPLDISWTASPSLRVVAILLCFLLGGLALYHFIQAHDFQRLFKKLDVKGIVGIEVFENTEDSFFDKYLNEVLYLFEHSDADAVVFEDLHRYDVTQIFEKLKEISDLLYQRKQRTPDAYSPEGKSAPKFFYLIRDDVFSSSDRSKFFDFIIPVVPVIATDNAYDLMQERLAQAGFQDVFEPKFLRAVSLYLTDLRLINNIVNEYIVYQGLLDGNDLHRDANHQLAIIIYKNLFPKDFEQLQRGAGYVHGLFAARETLLANQRAKLEKEAQQIQERINHAQQEHLQSIDELTALYLPITSSVISIDGSYVGANLNRTEFVKEILSGNSIDYRDNRMIRTADVNALREQMEGNPEYQRRKQALEDQDTKQSSRLQARLAEISQEKNLLNTKKLSELIETDSSIWTLESLPEKREEFSYIIFSHEFDLLKYLIRDGYIDETYSIYISYFYPGSLSIQDKNFLLGLTNHREPDYSYPLDSPALVLEWTDESYFALEEIGNFSLFNYILEQKNYRLLRIWLESVDHWSEMDESSFTFPLALWRTTPHRGYLVQVVNDVVPHWFETWTERELLSNSEWKQYAVDTLLNYRLKSLQQMNHDDWLADAIAGREDFLQINDLADAEKLTTALRILEIRFRSLILREQDKPLAERIYQENLYELNREMLELWLFLFYDAPKGEALERSYTYLTAKPNEPLTRRVEADFPEYLGVILSQDDPSFSDAPQAALALLNHSETDEEDGSAYIQHLETVLENLREVEQKAFWPVLLDEDRIAFCWENIIAYYMEYCDGTNPLDSHLVGCLQRGGSISWMWRKLREEMGEDKASALYEKLIRCTALALDRYRMLLKPIGAHYTSFSIKGLPDEYVEILIELGIIAVTAENVKFMRASYPGQMANFLIQDKCAKLSDMMEAGEASLEDTELAALLEDERLGDSAALRLLELHGKTVSVAGKKYSEAVQMKIIENYFDVEDVNWFLVNFDCQSGPVQQAFIHCIQTHIKELCNAVETEETIPIPVYAYTLQSLTPKETKELRQYLPDKKFELVCTTNKKPRFPGLEDVRVILEYFKTQGWISSYQLLPSGGYRAFPKQRKPIKTP